MIKVRSAPREHWRWLASRARVVPSNGFGALEAVKNGTEPERVIGMVGFDGETPNGICISVAIDEPLAIRRLLRPTFGLVFLEMGKAICWASVLSTNQKAQEIALGVGFREVFRGKDWHDHGVDVLVYEMKRSECRWIGRA